MIEVACATPDETRALASRLGSLIHPDDVIVLAGPLGSGKTLFTGGLAAGLGVDEPVVSPSFVLVRQYNTGFLPLVHVDVYRLGSFFEFDDLDALENARNGLLVIEWGDAVESALPADHLKIEMVVEEDGSRIVKMDPRGKWATRDLESIK